jgi:hypothetical protein
MTDMAVIGANGNYQTIVVPADPSVGSARKYEK